MSGVKYIDLKNNNFTFNSPVTIKGVYDRVKSTSKRIVLTNFSINGDKSHDIEGTVLKVSDTVYVVSWSTDAANNYLHVANNDEITLMN